MASKSSKSSSKSASRSASKKVSVKKSATQATERKLSAFQTSCLKLLSRPTGATLADLVEKAELTRPVMMVVNAFKSRGYKTNVVKKEGEPTRYFVKA